VWRKIRIGVLLLILAIASWSTWYDRLSTTDWDETLTVGVYPIDEPDDQAIHDYVAPLGDPEIADVESFLNEEAAEYGIAIDRPVSVRMYRPVTEKPPERDADSGFFGNLWWSLKMRMYAGRAARSTGQDLPQIRIFVRYHDPEVTRELPHSMGLQKGAGGRGARLRRSHHAGLQQRGDRARNTPHARRHRQIRSRDPGAAIPHRLCRT
jgi:hypothetical protein